MNALGDLLVGVRAALAARNSAQAAALLAEFQARLQRRIELELRVLQPALAHASIPGRDARRELELEYVQLRELARILREELAASTAQGRASGLLENLERRLRAHASELERVYYPAALPWLGEAERSALLESGATRAQPN